MSVSHHIPSGHTASTTAPTTGALATSAGAVPATAGPGPAAGTAESGAPPATTFGPAPTIARDSDEARALRAVRRRGWLRLLGVRSLQGAFVVWAAVTLTFIGIHLAPGDTIDTLLGQERSDLTLRAQVTAEWGLDRPVVIQYLSYLSGVLHGDFGTSYSQNKPVLDIFTSQIGSTLQLTGAAVLIAVAVALTVSLTTSGRSPLRTLSTAGELAVLSTPSFWLALVLLTVFSFRLRWFPVVGDDLRALVLPALSIGVPVGAYLTQVLREDLDLALGQPYVLTARSRGASTARVTMVHALRHAAVPAVTIGGLIVGSLLGGAAVVETVFGRSGLGHIAVAATQVKDMPVILGVAFFASAVFVIASTLVDAAALALDPRMRTR